MKKPQTKGRRGPRAGTLHLDKRATQLIELGAGEPDDLLTTDAVAAWLGVSKQWLEIARQRGTGPKFVRVGERMVRYKRDTVLKWLSGRERQRAQLESGS